MRDSDAAIEFVCGVTMTVSDLVCRSGWAREDVVRDYELDCQGIVNNSNYLRYMEHARHQYLLELGIDFAALHRSGVDLVVARSEVDFKSPLRSGDKYLVTADIKAIGPVRFRVAQQVLRSVDQRLMARGVHICVAVRTEDGRPIRCPELLAKVEFERANKEN